MKTISKYFFLLMVLALNSFAHAADSSSYSDFLQRMGFEKYSEQAQRTLDANPNIHVLAKKALEFNVTRYRVVNSARLLTMVIVEESFDKMNQPPVREKILNLATYLLEPHPLLTREPLPANVQALTDSEAYVKARSTFLQGKILERFNAEKATLIAAMLDLAPSQDIKDMDALIQSYLISKYTDRGLQQTRFWGRALAASVVRYARINHKPEIEASLQAKVAARGVNLGNFITSTVSYSNDQHQNVSVKLANGDFVNEYAKGAESYFISVGVEPSQAADKQFADLNNLLGKKRYITSYVTPEIETAIIDKARDHKSMTAKEQKVWDFMQENPPVGGYSHVGMVEIKRDAATGIEMPWVWDVYPNAALGGVRFLGVEGFSYAEKFRKIGFTHYDEKKFFQYYMRRTGETGYMPKVWRSWAATFDSAGKLDEDHSKRFDWPSIISEADQQRLQRFTENEAVAWYSQEIIPRVLSVMKGYMLSPEAMVFAHNFANVEHASYCSQVFVLAFLQGVNIDPQPSQDRYSPLLKAVVQLHKEVASYFNVNERIIAPSGFAWQSQLLKKHTMIDFDPNPVFRITADMLAPLKPRLSRTPAPAVQVLQPAPASLVDFVEDDL